jgi:hypothetical protein
MKYKLLFAFVLTLFLGILAACYVIAREANPVFLDERGRPAGGAR